MIGTCMFGAVRFTTPFPLIPMAPPKGAKSEIMSGVAVVTKVNPPEPTEAENPLTV